MADVGIFNWSLLALQPPGWGGVLLAGFAQTVQIAIGGYILGLVLGLAGAIGKLYGGPVTRDLLEVYTTLVRAVPELVLMLILFYGGTDVLNRLSALAGYGPINVSGLASGVFVIGVVLGAYATEIIRAAIMAVHFGQIEAARAYGMPTGLIMRRITLPAMLPHAIPGLSNLWLTATKSTSLLAVVGFTELMLVTRQAAGATKSYMLFFLAAGALYMLITHVSNLVIGLIERRYSRGLPGAAQ
ncbi:ABC transporter permease subunit [Rhizobium leguminosarum]|uniref:ABC transporter permease subunit n=1 Tax=Rhizobium leguminosarum TaxID=384 RepID=A0A6P0AZT1_RHILE|nr:ABC transporter permease subunit [Rhizobium leguminosarum]NEI32628.1 ABC transporter permease subunit [Rhizobium leguminosarum]NEI39387.1 ABC transporter permease subunit [Rhizobium leguminosarum]